MDDDAEVVIPRGDGGGCERQGGVAFCIGDRCTKCLVGVSIIPDVIHTGSTDVGVVGNVGDFGIEGDGVVHLNDVG